MRVRWIGQHTARRVGWGMAWTAVLAVGLVLRVAGLYRDLDHGTVHPDEPKQVVALENFLHGTYVWYTGSLFYDGYPYGLNHVDEWLLRPVLAARRGGQALIHGRPDLDRVPPRAELYRLARALRLLYAAITLAATVVVARFLFPGRPGLRWLVVAVFALSPLAAVVTHFATGDIGVDMFVMLAMAGLCRHAETRRWRWLIAAGFAVGAGFACKFQGLLGGLALALFAMQDAAVRRSFRAFVTAGAASLAGAAAGAILLTPASLIRWTRTWTDIWLNFGFIRNYNVTAEFMALPRHEQVVRSVGSNLGPVAGSLGWGLGLAGVAGLVVVCLRHRSSAEDSAARARVLRSIGGMAVIAFLLSITGKPNVQPFHFSWLVAPLALGAGGAFAALDRLPRPWGRTLGFGLGLLVLGELAAGSERELFFWRRQDTLALARSFGPTVVRPSEGRSAPLRTLEFEGPNPAVFRNRPRRAWADGAGDWLRIGQAPAPAIPYPEPLDWIVLNGPVFPRDDRMVLVPADRAARRAVVGPRDPGALTLGLRSGGLPVRVSVQAGGVRREVSLEPHAQEVVTLVPRRTRRSGNPDLGIVSLTARSRGGPAWVTVLASPGEETRFRWFGGESVAPPALSEGGRNRVASAMAQARYLEGRPPTGTRVVAELPRGDAFALTGPDSPLEAGVYEVVCEVEAGPDGAVLRVDLDDRWGFPALRSGSVPVDLEPGPHEVRFQVAKAFAPYDGRLVLRALDGEALLRRWSAAPATATMLEALGQAHEPGPPPSWRRRWPESPDRAPDGWPTRNARFGRGLVLEAFRMPSVVSRSGDGMEIHCAMGLEPGAMDRLEEHHVFLHLRDGDGEQVWVEGFPLPFALVSAASGLPAARLDPPDLPPGEYTLEIGVWNVRTTLRLPVRADDRSRQERRHRRLEVGRLRVEE